MGSGTSRTTASGSIATDETGELIASNKVEGTAVYNRQGEHLGTVYNFMVGKRSGQVAYAVMSFGGLLGMGDTRAKGKELAKQFWPDLTVAEVHDFKKADEGIAFLE